jgi:hypothetical protein
MSDNNEDPKIIVDEDWKSQVEKEKEQIQEAASQAEAAGPDEGEIPPASILMLVSMLGSQAMSALGLLPDPSTGEVMMNRPIAKHFIDLIGVLQEKTNGNLTEDEAAHVRDALHQLRMVFVSTGGEGVGPEGESDQPPASKIELP